MKKGKPVQLRPLADIHGGRGVSLLSVARVRDTPVSTFLPHLWGSKRKAVDWGVGSSWPDRLAGSCFHWYRMVSGGWVKGKRLSARSVSSVELEYNLSACASAV